VAEHVLDGLPQPRVRLGEMLIELRLHPGVQRFHDGTAVLLIEGHARAILRLRDHGRGGRWMRSQDGAQLRELVTSAYAVDVVVQMHNADAFQDEGAAGVSIPEFFTTLHRCSCRPAAYWLSMAAVLRMEQPRPGNDACGVEK